MITRCPDSQLLKHKSESCSETFLENLCGTPLFSTLLLKLGCRPPAGRVSRRGVVMPRIRRLMFYHHPAIRKGIDILKSCLRLRLVDLYQILLADYFICFKILFVFYLFSQWNIYNLKPYLSRALQRTWTSWTTCCSIWVTPRQSSCPVPTWHWIQCHPGWPMIQTWKERLFLLL